MKATWYVLEDDSCGDPRDVHPDKTGKLVHKDGRKVAYAPHGPRSRSVDPEAERAKKKAPPKPKVADVPAPPVTSTKDMKAEAPTRVYKTRESKAD